METARVSETDKSPTIEAKYIFNAGTENIVLGHLNSLCQPDPEFPVGGIASLYLDSPGLHLLQEKVDSDFIKSKLRLRWYTSNESSSNVKAYLELKSKEGARRHKHRIEVSLPSNLLVEGHEDFCSVAEIIAPVINTLGISAKFPLFPMITIRYNRHRFIDHENGSRISLDHNIGFSRVNPIFFPDLGGRSSRHCVLEVKNPSGHLPMNLRSLSHVISPREAFSKYEECWNLYSDATYRRQTLTNTV